MNNADSGDRISVAQPLSSINCYVDKACETSRCLIEAEDVYYAGHVVECSIEAAENGRFNFLAFVLQTTALKNAPHEVKTTVCNSAVDRASCSCKAGNYKCKHIVASLLHINGARTFDRLSPTDQPQKWGKAQKDGIKQKYEPRAIVDLPCTKKAKIKEPAQPEGNILGRLLKNLGHQSAAKMHLESTTEIAVADCGENPDRCEPEPRDITLMGTLHELRRLLGNCDLQKLLEHVKNARNCEDIAAIEQSTRHQAKSGLWWQHRVGMITASIAYSVFTRVKTLRTKMEPHDLRPLLKKVMRQTNVCTAAMRRGSMLEESAKKFYAQQQQSQQKDLIVTNCGLIVMDGRPYIGASPDGLVQCQRCPKRVLAVKCPESLEKFLMKITEKNDKATTEKLKRASTYFCQIQVQMGLAGLKQGELFVFLNDEKNMCIPVPFDEEYFRDVVERSTYFFKEYVLPHILCVIRLPILLAESKSVGAD
ncbi:uncharacterized protein LOC144095641 [Amblyomma americanum]